MEKFTIIAGLLCIAGTVTAQNEADVQRYTNLVPPGTARFGAMGGAFTALGGDMSAIHVNPASIGVFRFTELSFTPSIETKTIRTELNGSASTGFTNGFAVGNAGLVLVSPTQNPFWRSVNVGFTVNRLNTFNDELRVQGTVPLDRSLMQSFLTEATGALPSALGNFGAGLAFDTFVIDQLNGDPNQTNYVGIVQSGDMNQSQTVTRSGRMNEFAISVGGNYDDRLFIGGKFGIVSSYYEVRNEITESPTIPAATDLVRYRYRDDLIVEGFGVNVSAGFIYRFENGLRVGGSIQTPTSLRLQDRYRASITNTLRNPDEVLQETSPDDFLNYRVRTPWRYTAGVAGVIQGKAILSAQYEYVNFPGAEMRSPDRRSTCAFCQDVNDIVRAEFRGQHVLRGGIEFRMTKALMARGGAAFFTNEIPINEASIAGRPSRLQLSGGVGYRQAAWNLDLTYIHGNLNEPYRVSSAGFVQELNNTFGVVSLTLGFRL